MKYPQSISVLEAKIENSTKMAQLPLLFAPQKSRVYEKREVRKEIKNEKLNLGCVHCWIFVL